MKPEQDTPGASEQEAANDGSNAGSTLNPTYATAELPNTLTIEKDFVEESRWRKNVTPVVEILGLTALIVYTVFSVLQWAQIRYTNRLTARALDGSDKTLTETLKKMQAQTDATNHLYGEAQKQTMEAQKQTGNTATMATNSGIQAAASRRSAKAAKSAADTAKQTLRISERAYITVATPQLDIASGFATLPVLNGGHIPSGKATVLLHEATLNIVNPSLFPDNPVFTEKHWQGQTVDSIPTGTPFTLKAVVPSLTLDEINSGHQMIFIAGSMTYSDGFLEDGEQTWSFCWQTEVIVKTKQVLWAPCDPSSFRTRLSIADEYPSEKYHLKY